MRFALIVLNAALFVLPTIGAQLAIDARTAWAQVQSAEKAIPTIPPLHGRLPTKAELAEFRNKQTAATLAAADLARKFTRRFPSNLRTTDSQNLCHRLLDTAIRRGAHDRLPEMRLLEKAILTRSNISENDRFRIRKSAITRETAVIQAQGGDMMPTYEKATRELLRDFPTRPESYQMLYAVGVRSSGAKARKIAQEILAGGGASADLKKSARIILSRINRLGKPLRIKFEAIDGRKIDTAKMKGKVILIDFWATWSAPSISRLEQLERIQQKYQDKEVAILGISFDHQRQALSAYVAHRKLAWPQHFDNGSKVKTLREILNVDQIPSLWVLDKKGVLRSTNAHQNLGELLAQLIAEPNP